MDDLENILDELKEKLDGRYENTSSELIEGRIFVSFNDTHNNALAVYPDRDRFCVTNFKNWDDGEYEVITNWTDVIRYESFEGIVDFFDRSYDKMFKENEEFEEGLKKCMSDRTYKIIFGEYISIGKRVSN